MNILKKSLIATTLAVGFAGPAAAQQAPRAPLADPATMTADEQATIATLNSFRSCAIKTQSENDAAREKRYASAAPIVAARATSHDATRAAAEAAGLSAKLVKELLDEMASNDTDLVKQALDSTLTLPDPQESCLKSLKIDVPSMQGKLNAIGQKYGRGVFVPKP